VSTRPIVRWWRTGSRHFADIIQAEFIPLGMDDVSEMLALGDIARPRPSDTGTPSLGGYVGVRRTGQLIAMGGERFRLSGFTELSGIWVRPATRGIALGADATAYLTRRSLDRGEQPFLHVFPGNTAIALYVYLGFHERARLFVLWRRQTAGHLAMGSCVTQSIFFGWKVVATSFLVGTIGFGYNGPAVFLHVLHQQHGWSVSVISSAITAHFLVSAFLVAHLPDAHRRFGTAAVT
jgi:hypothetical protein